MAQTISFSTSIVAYIPYNILNPQCMKFNTSPLSRPLRCGSKTMLLLCCFTLVLVRKTSWWITTPTTRENKSPFAAANKRVDILHVLSSQLTTHLTLRQTTERFTSRAVAQITRPHISSHDNIHSNHDKHQQLQQQHHQVVVGSRK